MKNIVIFLLSLIFLASCDNTTKDIEYEEIYCPKCDGVGMVKADAGTRIVMGIMTFGSGALIETTECDICNGTGIVKRKKLDSQVNKNHEIE